MSQPTEPTGKKQIAAKHRDLIAAGDIYDILDELPPAERYRVLGWLASKYQIPKKEEADER